MKTLTSLYTMHSQQRYFFHKKTFKTESSKKATWTKSDTLARSYYLLYELMTNK